MIEHSHPFRNRIVHLLTCSVLGLTVFACILGGCSQKPTSDQMTDSTMTDPSIEAVLETHTDSLMAIRGVVGVGQGTCDDEPCIRVYASERTPEIEREIPESIEGYPVDVEVTGAVGPRSNQ